LRGFLPRLLAGNGNTEKHTLSITHTYYDCSPITDEGGYWKRASADFFDSSIYAPVFTDGTKNTELVFYPIYSPSDYSIDLDFLDEKGNSILKIPGFKTFAKDNHELFRINFRDVLTEANISLEIVKGVFISKSWTTSDMIPSRLKFGLNVSAKPDLGTFPSNICFNSELGIPKTLQKAGTRKWAPIIHNGESVIVINNSSTLKKYDRSANVTYKIFRTTDNQYLEREVVIPPLGQLRIETEKDEEVRNFIGNQPGWIYIDSDNPFTNAWYFNFGSAGVVGADHSF
jgi:hypothetical protein